MIHWKITYALMFLKFKLLFRGRIRGAEKLPKAGPYMLAANHKSYMDPLLVGLLSTTPIHYMAKEELFKIPLFKNLITWFYAFPVKRDQFDKNAIKMSTDILKKGGKLCVFPEGKRVRDKDIGEILPGALYIAYRAKVPIYPVAIYGAEKIIPNGKKLPRFPRLSIEVGEAINLMHTAKDDAVDAKQVMEDGAILLHERISELYEKGRKL